MTKEGQEAVRTGSQLALKGQWAMERRVPLGGKEGPGGKRREEMERSSNKLEGAGAEEVLAGAHPQCSDSLHRLNLGLDPIVLTERRRKGSWNMLGWEGALCAIILWPCSLFRHFGFRSCWEPSGPVA